MNAAHGRVDPSPPPWKLQNSKKQVPERFRYPHHISRRRLRCQKNLSYPVECGSHAASLPGRSHASAQRHEIARFTQQRHPANVGWQAEVHKGPWRSRMPPRLLNCSACSGPYPRQRAPDDASYLSQSGAWLPHPGRTANSTAERHFASSPSFSSASCAAPGSRMLVTPSITRSRPWKRLRTMMPFPETIS